MTTFALQISSTDMVLIALLGLTALTALAAQSKVKTWISVLLGLMMGTVGLDMFTAQARFTGPWLELLDGFPIIVVMVGVFAFSEVLSSIMEGQMGVASQNKNMSTRLRLKEMRGIAKPTLLGSLIGTGVGVVPGMGAGPASWFAYSAAKRISSKPQLFGKGSPEGIAGPEAANNATVGGALVPLMTLGVPGSPTTAIILGAFVIHGIVPGPKLFSTQPDLVAGIFVGFLATTVAMYIVGRFLTPLFARSLKLPQKYLLPLVILFSLVGVYAAREVIFDVAVAAIIGIAFFILRRLGYSLPAFVLAFVLTPMIEENFRRTLIVGDGMASMTQSPITMVLLVLVLLAALWPLISRLIPASKKKEAVLADN